MIFFLLNFGFGDPRLGLGPQLNATVMRLGLSRKVPNTSFDNWSVMHV